MFVGACLGVRMYRVPPAIAWDSSDAGTNPTHRLAACPLSEPEPPAVKKHGRTGGVPGLRSASRPQRVAPRT